MSPTPLQTEALARLEANAGGAIEVRWDDARGVASLVRGVGTPLLPPAVTPRATVARLVATFGVVFGPAALAASLRSLDTRTDPDGRTRIESYQVVPRYQDHDGPLPPLEVFGSRLVVHLQPDGGVSEVQSSCWREVDVERRPRLTRRELTSMLAKAARTAPGFGELDTQMRAAGKKGFPVMRPLRLVAYPWQARFRLAWTTYAYQDLQDDAGAVPDERRLALAQVFVDAITGERFLVTPVGMHAEVPVVGSGLGVTRTSGAFVNRILDVVQVDGTMLHRLIDRTHARDIITYDLAISSTWPTPAHMALAASAVPPTLPVSENAGGNTWLTVAAAPAVSRANGQQPEVDAHYFVCDAYEWYDAIAGGRAGWDNGWYPTTTVPPNLPVRVCTHVIPFNRVDAMFDKGFDPNRWVPFLMLWDCNLDQACVTPGDRALDYYAGSRTVVGHEYQHGITAFSFKSPAGDPGIGYIDWAAALHEGLSDVFGCLFSDSWTWGPEISPVGLVIRNAAYPRDPLTWANITAAAPCGWNQSNKDHFADATAAGLGQYDRGMVLAHCAFLMSAGGVHQRASRTPALIPVQPLGLEARQGRLVPVTARIWYEALRSRLQPWVTYTGVPAVDAQVFRGVREGCISEARALYGVGSREEKTTALAFYAVGLQPVGVAYGPDVTFMPWAAAWWRSRPYLGGMYASCPYYSSVDLFIDNGTGPGWNAVVNVQTASGPTQFENTVYCRVRNVGDQQALNVRVQFLYAEVGTAPVVWQPMQDRLLVNQVLNIGPLNAGASSFVDAAQNSPPPAASVKWWIPPLAGGSSVSHFCLRAVVTADNDVNTFNNTAQSNIAYVPFVSGKPLKLSVWSANELARPIPLEVDVDAAVPKGWKVATMFGDGPLKPGERRLVRISIDTGTDAAQVLEPPFDGDVLALLRGPVVANGRGALTGATGTADRLESRVALDLDEAGVFRGRFAGRVDVKSGELSGHVVGHVDGRGKGGAYPVEAQLVGRLFPWRRVNVSQLVEGRPVGGVTIEITGTGPGRRR